LSEADPFEAVLAHLHVRHRRGDRAEAICPAHDDHTASLSIAKGAEHPVVLHCHAGCPPEAILLALGLTWDALTGTGQPHIVASYHYTDAAGGWLYSVDRWVPKAFRPRLPDGTPVRPPAAVEVLYRLPEVVAAIDSGRTVYLVEGEKDADVAREFGLTATTAMSGATQPWLPQFTDTLRGARLVIVADTDVPGRTRARKLAAELAPSAIEVQAVVPRYGKDLADHLLAGYSTDLLDPLPAEGSLVRYTLGNVRVLPMRWAWQDWIPAGMLSLIEGEPGDGKSVLTCDLAARWTTGKPMPDDSANAFGGPVMVGMVSAEDDPARVIKPRIVVAGGDPNRIVLLAGMPIVGQRYIRNVDLETDVEALREAIEGARLKVLILDPLMAYLGSTRTAVDSEVRKVLTPLKVLAEETDCAIVCVRHLRKAGGKAVHAGGGSIAFTGQARSVMAVGQDPDKTNEGGEHGRVLAMTKTNVGVKPPSQSYWVVADAMGFILAPRVAWDGESELSAEDLMRQHEAASRAVMAEVTAEAIRWLTIEPLDFPTLKRRIGAGGVECSDDTLRRALRAIAHKIVTGLGASNKTVWMLNGPGELPPVPDGAESDIDGQPSTVSGSTDTRKGLRVGPVSDDSSEPPLLPEIDADQAVECEVCGNAEPGLLYITARRAWRCRQHPPDLG
jgi:putative DNA primase/helicase